MRIKYLPKILICLSLFILCSYFPTSVTAASQSIHQIYRLTLTSPFADTGIDIGPEGTLLTFRNNYTVLWPADRSAPYQFVGVGNSGDVNCTADDRYLLTGAKCWVTVGKIGDNDPFIIGPGTSFPVNETGRLFIGINMRPPYTGRGYSELGITYSYEDGLPPASPDPEPFLILPWNYQKKEVSYNFALTTINAFFDHEYPVGSYTLQVKEPIETRDSVVLYNSPERNNIADYSSHDGYDWGRSVGAGNGEDLLAPADGCVHYKWDKDCGNILYIDHKNYYQSKFCHLQNREIITRNTNPNQCVEVTQGEKIGLIGRTGNQDRITGPHIHFVITEDKNRDGNFYDNRLDGITDPFGWSGDGPDPWENFTFNFDSTERTGNDSHYLWLQQLDSGEIIVEDPIQPFEVEIEGIKITAPGSFLEHEYKVKYQRAVNPINLPDNYEALSNFQIKVYDFFNRSITAFSKFMDFDLHVEDAVFTGYNIDSLTIFTSDDGKYWTELPNTVFDESKNVVSGQTNHLSYFALVAKPLDTVSPETILQINNEVIEATESANFTPPIKLELSAQDFASSSAEASPSGVLFTAYKLHEDDPIIATSSASSWETYEEPISINEPGNYIFSYYSGDNADNNELVHSTALNLQEEASESAEIKFIYDRELGKIVASNNNSESTASAVMIDYPQGNEKRKNIITFGVENLLVEAIERITSRKDLLTFTGYEEEVDTESSTSSSLETTSFLAKRSINTFNGEPKIITQRFWDSDGQIKIKYNAKKDQSKITVTGEETIKVDGYRSLQAIANDKTIYYEIDPPIIEASDSGELTNE